jgi:hypothetical protein
MSTKTTTKSCKSVPFRVGDHVTFHFVNRTIRGIVSEVLGPIGVGGRRLYQVQVNDPSEEPGYFELPESELTPESDD